MINHVRRCAIILGCREISVMNGSEEYNIMKMIQHYIE